MKKLYLDTETCGLHGFAVLIQYAYDNGDINLFSPWTEPAGKTVELIEEFTKHCFVGFNCNFDWFHLVKLYTTFRLLPKDLCPVDDIELIAHKESEARFGPCVKPASCLDLLLHSRKGPYQCLMDRKDIRVRRVPTCLAEPLANVLENTIEFDGIMFARRANTDAPRWSVLDVKNGKDEIDPEFKDVCLKFSPAGGLKVLAQFALGVKPEYLFSEVEVDKELRPYEKGYIPFALGLSNAEKNWEVIDDKGKVNLTWPRVIKHHIEHWNTEGPQQRYAYDDVVYTRDLDKHFEYPEIGDDDSILACAIAAVRWHGYDVDIPGIKRLLEKDKKIVDKSPINVNAHRQVREYICEQLDDIEKVVLDESTGKKILESITNEFVVETREECIMCMGTGCPRCEGKGYLEPGLMPAAKRAKEVLNIRRTKKEIELFDKLLAAGRFHADFKVIGTLSSRMAGGSGLNAQGIKKDDEIRSLFPLSWDGMVLSGGDLSACEVAIAETVFKDPTLRKEMLSGKKIHALFGMELYPGMTYEEIMATDGTKDNKYGKAKAGLFAILYGGDAGTIHRNIGIPLPIAEAAFDNFQKKHPGLRETRAQVARDFGALQQPGGIGSAVIWKDPKDYIETILGFRRYFTLENKVIKALFNLSRKPPKEWKSMDIKVVRRDRVQTAAGAVSSALYGAAFQVQSANIRAGNNHLIQSVGAVITKNLQRKVWDIQPAGVNEWHVCPMQVHDEIMCVTRPDLTGQLHQLVRGEIEGWKKTIPLLDMEWGEELNSWADK